MTIEKVTPLPEQEWAIKRILSEKTKRALIADDMGFGKTVIAAETLLRLAPKRALIIGVKDTFGTFDNPDDKGWAGTILAQSDGAVRLRRMNSTKPGLEAYADFMAGVDGWYFVGIEWFRTQDWEQIPDLDREGNVQYVFDKKTDEPVIDKRTGEQKVKTKAKQKKVFHKKAKLKIGELMLVLDEIHLSAANRGSQSRKTLNTIRDADWIIGLSGTPVGNEFENWWSITNLLWRPVAGTSFVDWVTENCIVVAEPIGGGKFANKVVGEKVPGNWVSQLPCFIRRENDDKPPEPFLLPVELTPQQRMQYDQMVTDMLAYVPREADGTFTEDILMASVPVSQRQRLRFMTLGDVIINEGGEVDFAYNTNSAKLGALQWLVDQWPGHQVLIFTASKKFAKVAAARMHASGYPTGVWTGDSSTQDRARLKQDFLDGKIRYIVGVIQAMATGLDGFQKVSNRLIWLDEVEGNPSLMRQAQARLYRRGRKLDGGGWVEVKLVARDTWDLGVMQGLVQKEGMLRASMPVAASAI